MSQQFKVGDKVKFGDAEGVVTRIHSDRVTYPVLAGFGENCRRTELAFTENGKLYYNQPEGFPRLTLVSRAERFVEKEVYRYILKPNHETAIGFVSDTFFNTKEEALSHPGSIGYAVSKVFIKEGEG